MESESRGRRIAVVALAVVAAVGIGVMAYQAGVSHGLALQSGIAAGAPQAGAATPPPYPYPYPYGRYGFYRPWHFGFFGPLVFVFFWLFLVRGIFFRGGWGRGRHFRDGEVGADRFDDWHRRAHERMDRGGPAPQQG